LLPWKAVTNAHSEPVSVAWATQCVVRMRVIILLSIACPVLQHFSTLSYHRNDFRKIIYIIEHNVCYDFL
jgi:hypothetical protein